MRPPKPPLSVYHATWRASSSHPHTLPAPCTRRATVQATPLVAGLAVGAAAYGARFAVQAFNSWKTAGPRLRQFYKGGFQAEMNRREAALILGCRESAPEEKVGRAGGDAIRVAAKQSPSGVACCCCCRSSRGA